MRTAYDLLEEPRGAAWRALLTAAIDACDTFLLVTRPALPLAAPASAVLARLRPFLLQVREAPAWPGTTLFGQTATLYRYQAVPASLALLAGAADGPYSWIQPDLPEDPCFFRPDGSPWFATIAHERDSYLTLLPAEVAMITDLVPRLVLRERGSSAAK
jgi:hypothetical protein